MPRDSFLQNLANILDRFRNFGRSKKVKGKEYFQQQSTKIKKLW